MYQWQRWYRTGTVAVTNGSAVVTGTTTGWTSQVKPGDMFTVDSDRFYEVQSVDSNTQITLASNFAGTTASSAAYSVVRNSPAWNAQSDVAAKLGDYLDEIRGSVTGPGYGGTSTTSLAVGSGTKTLTVALGLAYAVGSRVRIASSASPFVYMEGVVTSYSETTMVVSVDLFAGSGTFASWNLSLAGDRGTIGLTGPSYAGTSSTSLTVATGSQTLTTQAGLAYVVGSRIRVASSASPSNYLEGVVTAYSTTSLTFTCDLVGGSGTISSWNLSLAGDRGVIGLTGPSYAGTSTTSLTVGTGSRTLTTQAGLAYVVGSRIRVSSSASPSNYMEGVVTAYSTTSLTFTSDFVGGSGTIASWNLSLAGQIGPAGPTGASYAGTSTTSLTVGTGSQTLTTQASLAYVVGSRIRVASSASAANYMEGLVTAYSSTSLTFTADQIGGSGTIASWNLSLAGNPGQAPPLTVKGDLATFGTVVDRLPVGTNNFQLIADSTQALGLRWAAQRVAAGFTSYTPTISSGAALGSNPPTATAVYCDVGPLRFVEALITFPSNYVAGGGATTGSNFIRMTTPSALIYDLDGGWGREIAIVGIPLLVFEAIAISTAYVQMCCGVPFSGKGLYDLIAGDSYVLHVQFYYRTA